MATAAIVILFLLMLAAPCMLALRSAEQGDQPDSAILEARVAKQSKALETFTTSATGKPLTLVEMADQAELDAAIAQDRARDAHWAALAASARAARLRADAAAEAAAAAGVAAAQAMAELEADFSSIDFTRLRARGQAA